MRSYWNLLLSKIYLLVALPCSVLGQFNEVETPKGAGGSRYLFPINPGNPNYLAGTMGELRSTHFHGGIDIRTNNRIGIPVLATQDGYVSRANVSAFGFGTSLYLTHPDGNTSFYGHLDKISGRLGDHVKREQYSRKTFEIDFTLLPEEFKVKRGDTIALSGNTGSSQGPHLHFEIRDGNHALNPLKFGFTEIIDHIPPTPRKIALRTLDINSRINDRFGRFEFTLLKKSSSDYVLPFPILAHGAIGVELLAEDRMDNSPGHCGINYIEMSVDSQKVFSQFIERVDLEETRAILALMDYKTLETRGKRFNKLYVDDGNKLPFYQTQHDGIVEVNGNDRAIKIALRDESGNLSYARFKLKNIPIVKELTLSTSRTAAIESDLLENVLMISSRRCPDVNFLKVFSNGQAEQISPSYRSAQQTVYLIDLQKTMPDSVATCAGNLKFHFKDVVPSRTRYTYYSDWVDATFPENALYDTLYLNTNHRIENNKESFVIGQRTTPLQRPIQVTLKPSMVQYGGKNLGIYRKEGGGVSYLGAGEWSAEKVRFTTQELGEFIFRRDSLPPSIGRIRLNNQSARFRIRDGLSGISYYEASVNGLWLLMSYDYKTGILQSDRLDPKKPLKGDFELKVVDRAGNERIFKQKIL